MASADNLDQFFAHVRAGQQVEFTVADGESLDYPHILLRYADGRAEIIAMADSETEAWRSTLENASPDDIDRSAGRALQDLDTRPYRQWKRAQLTSRTEAIRSEQKRLDAFRDDLDAQAKAVRGNSMDDLAQRMRLNDMSIRASRRHIAYSKQIQAINFELHVRDDAKLVAEFGPGAD